MPVIYQLCDVFVLPSTGPGESWGLSINEAMAAGKVVIASDRCGGAIDLIIKGENGYIFKAGNVDDLILKMKNLFCKQNQMKEMNASSILKIQQFTFEKYMIAVENLVDSNG